jgi:glycosyltransferase involved in cell wall biosynthesis
VTGLRIAHVQPLSVDLLGYRDDDWGVSFRYFLSNMAAAQVARGDRPTVHLLGAADRRHRREAVVGGIDLVFHPSVEPQPRRPERFRFSRQLSVSMLRALRAAEVDVVHFHGLRSMHAMLGATAFWAQREHLPLVAQDHGPRSVGPFVRRVQLAAMRRCDGLLAANEDSLAELAAKAPGVPVDMVVNGVDPETFHPGPTGRDGDGPFRVLVVSRLMADKDPLTMADALVQLAARGVAVEATIVGAGELRPAVAERLHGAMPATIVDKLRQHSLAALYRSADVLLLTSLREGFNQATVEAMASGTPVVASDIAGIREGVGPAGLLAPPGDATAFADHLARLAIDPALRADLARRSLERSRQLTWPAIVDQLDEIYCRAIDRRRRQRPGCG